MFRPEVIAHILIIRAGALGDTILLLPVFTALRHRFPNAVIEAIGYPTPLSLLLHAGVIDRIRSIDDAEMAGLFKEAPMPALRAAASHMKILVLSSAVRVVDRPSGSMADGSRRSADDIFTVEGRTSEEMASYIGRFDLIIAYCRDPDRILRRNLHRYAPHACVLVADPFPPHGVHVADWYLTPLQTFNIRVDDKTPRIILTPDDVTAARSFLKQHGLSSPVIAIHPGSGSRQKCWPAACFAAVIDRLTDQGINPLLICGPADREVLSDVEANLRHARRVVCLKDPPLLKLAAVLSVCDGFLGNDSGVTHLAAAVGCPTVAIFGPTDPAVWGPREQYVSILSCEEGWVNVDTVITALMQNLILEKYLCDC